MELYFEATNLKGTLDHIMIEWISTADGIDLGAVPKPTQVGARNVQLCATRFAVTHWQLAATKSSTMAEQIR